jgi:hypothetical protein
VEHVIPPWNLDGAELTGPDMPTHDVAGAVEKFGHTTSPDQAPRGEFIS